MTTTISPTGTSQHLDGAVAAREAVASARDGRDVQEGDLMVVFCASVYDMTALHAAAREAAAPARLVGCTSATAFTSDTHVPRGVVAIHVAADGVRFGIGSAAPLRTELREGAATAVRAAREDAAPTGAHAAVLLLSDGLAGDQREILRGAYSIAGAGVPIVGGAAADDLLTVRTSQLTPTGVLDNGVVAVWIDADHPLGLGVAHGWEPIGEPVALTRTDGPWVQEFDGRPAVPAYEAIIGTSLGHPDDRGNAALRSMHHPLGIPNNDGTYAIRHVMNTEGDSLLMFGQVPEQAFAQVMTTTPEGLLAGAREAARTARDTLGRTPRGALAFSCVARLAALGARVGEEASQLQDGLDGAPLAGFFTYGEFGLVRGSLGFHNATVVVLAW